jgi:hypothetical protein
MRGVEGVRATANVDLAFNMMRSIGQCGMAGWRVVRHEARVLLAQQGLARRPSRSVSRIGPVLFAWMRAATL